MDVREIIDFVRVLEKGSNRNFCNADVIVIAAAMIRSEATVKAGVLKAEATVKAARIQGEATVKAASVRKKGLS